MWWTFQFAKLEPDENDVHSDLRCLSHISYVSGGLNAARQSIRASAFDPESDVQEKRRAAIAAVLSRERSRDCARQRWLTVVAYTHDKEMFQHASRLGQDNRFIGSPARMLVNTPEIIIVDSDPDWIGAQQLKETFCRSWLRRCSFRLTRTRLGDRTANRLLISPLFQASPKLECPPLFTYLTSRLSGFSLE